MRWVSLYALLVVVVAASVLALPPPPPDFLPGNPSVCTATNGGVEACDGIDNDCNGLVDDNLTRMTACGVGLCEGNTGNETCSDGSWVNDTCDAFAGAVAEVCSDGIDNDCDGLVDNDDTTCPIIHSPSGSSSPRSGDGFYIPPSSVEVVDDQSAENASPMSLPLNWSYIGGVASASVAEPTSPLKRLSGNVPWGLFLKNSSLVSADREPLEAPLPDGFSLYHRFGFDGEVDGVVFEELRLTFTVNGSWLSSRDGHVMVLYPFDGRWRTAVANYSEGSGLYHASLVNVPLRTIALGVGPYEEEVSIQPEPVVEVNATSDAAAEPETEKPRSFIAWAIVVPLLVGALLAAFFLVPDVPFLGGIHDGVRSWFSGPGKSASSVAAQERPADPVEEKRRAYAALLSRLDQYIASQRAKGVSDQQLASSLRSAGWDERVIASRLGR